MRDHATSRDAFAAALQLATAADRAGMSRFWVGESHDAGKAWSTPLLLLPLLGAATSRLAIGTGACLIPLHAPLAVAEAFAMLSALYPGRVDCGLGGGYVDAEIVHQLLPVAELPKSRSVSWNFAANIDRLLKLWNCDFPDGHRFRAGVNPSDAQRPTFWILGVGSSKRELAATKGAHYCYSISNSRSEADPSEIAQYFDSFKPNASQRTPHAAVEVQVLCVESERALAQQRRKLKLSEHAVIGTASQCSEQLREVSDRYNVTELILKVAGIDHYTRFKTIHLLNDTLIRNLRPCIPPNCTLD